MTGESESHLQRVYSDYVSRLNPESGKFRFIQLIEANYREHPVVDIQNELETLARQSSDRKARRWMERFMMPVMQYLKQYFSMIDQMVCCCPALSVLVWGGIKAVTEAIVGFRDSLEPFQSILEDLSDHLSDLKECRTLYAKCDPSTETVQSIIGRSYLHIIDLSYRITKVLNRTQGEQSLSPLDGKHKLQRALKAVEEDAQILTRVCQAAESQSQHQAGKGLTEYSDELMAERDRQTIERIATAEERKLNEKMHLALQAERKALRASKSEAEVRPDHAAPTTSISGNASVQFGDIFHINNNHQQLIESIGGDHNYGADLFHTMLDRYPGTCEWIFQTKTWQDWTSVETSAPILWLHGKHGCGKSYVCAAAIQRVRESGNTCIAFHFITRGKEVTRLQLLRSLAYQLVKCVEIQFGDIDQDVASLIRSCSIYADFERLIARVLSELNRVFIFLDGLDEATHDKDIEYLVVFLRKQAIEQRGRFRLWLSSQNLPKLEDTIYHKGRNQVLELAVQTKDTEKDIARFLDHELSESTKNADSLAQLFVSASINTEVQGSFLWAVKMVEELKDQAENTEDMLGLAERGLPTSMHDIYDKIVISYKQKRARSGELPLWKIILSLLTFAKRPLHISEVREAISITKGKSIELMRNEQIVGECPGLVRYIKRRDGGDDGTLILSHGSVHKFLREHTSDDKKQSCTLEDCKQHELVDPDILAICCIKYLLRECYSSTLKVYSRANFECCDGSFLKEHHLALYVSKYWYRHCDESTVSDEIQTLVKTFLLSDNFRTCLQIQSVSIIGHFLISYNPMTGDPSSMKQNLPTWTRQIDDDSFHFQAQYRILLREWNHLLQTGISSQFIGEIDRILWPSLGSCNFLSKGRSRYKSFPVGEGITSADLDLPKSSCQVSTSSADGTVQTICRVGDIGNEDITIAVESWKLDGISNSELFAQSTIQVNKADALWTFFSTPCQQRLSLIPKATQGRLNNTVRFGCEGAILHIGALLFTCTTTSGGFTYQPFSIDNFEAADTYFEESCQKGTVIALGRRRRLKKYKDSHMDKAEERAKRIKTMRASRSSRYGPDSDDQDSDNQELIDDEIEPMSDAESIDNDAGSESMDDGVASSLDGQSSADEKSNPDSFDLVSESHSESGGDSLNDLNEASQSESDDDLSSLLSDVSQHPSRTDSDNERNDCGNTERGLDTEANEAFEYPVNITPKRFYSPHCDVCGVRLQDMWYHCALCEDNDYDLCGECLQKGFWCYDLKHQLFEVGFNFVGNVINWNNHLIRQEIQIYETHGGSPQQLFSWRKDAHDMLHESPPCFHPLTPLMVWPIGQERLLFANYVDGTKKIRSLRSAVRKSRQLSTNLHFSDTGEVLYVATVEAVRLLEKKQSSSICEPRVYELTFVLTALRVSSEDPVGERPVLLSQQSRSIGPWKKPYSPVIPYTWTWAKTEVYFTISGRTLQVYKIPLPLLEAPTTTQEAITTPAETIFLPYSAQDRAVQYFPPSKPEAASTVIIGPHHGSEPSLPIGIYLQEKDLGKWIDVRDMPDMNAFKRLKRRQTGKFEEFDTDDDCDIIPWDGN